MRKLALALAGAAVLGAPVPASAQYVDAQFGFGPRAGWGGWGGAYAYNYGPSVGVQVGAPYAYAPAAESYTYVDRPRRVRRAARTRVVAPHDPAFGGFAYAPGYGYGGSHWGGPSVSVGVGVGPGWHRWW
jgi:hypothetical protein